MSGLPATGTPGGSASRVSIYHKSTPLRQYHTFWIATVHSRTTTASFECSRTSCLRSASTPACEHVTSALIDLHWLSVAAGIKFKICVLAYQSLNSGDRHLADKPTRWQTSRWQTNSLTRQLADKTTRWQSNSLTVDLLDILLNSAL